jgi:hypothetical protein
VAFNNKQGIFMTKLRLVSIILIVLLIASIASFIVSMYLAGALIIILACLLSYWYRILSEELILLAIYKNNMEIEQSKLLSLYPNNGSAVSERLIKKGLISKEGTILRFVAKDYKFSFSMST